MPPLKGEGDQRSWWRGSLWNLLLNVRGFTEAPLSHLRCQLPFQGSLIEKKPPLKGEGDQRSWWRGFLWNLLRNV